MTSLALAFSVAAAASLLATPLARRLAWRVHALDHADGTRKLHAGPVPHLGGIGLFVALLAGTIATCGDSLLDPTITPLPLALLLSASLVCTLGWLDDRYSLRVRWKLLGQVLATMPLIFAGEIIERIELGGLVIDLGWWAIPFSIGWLVAGVNALNFIDGADGLAATVGLVAAAATALVADRLGHADVTVLAVVLAGGLSGFLLYNWQPATIYLGDAGSMTVGLWLAALAAVGPRTPEIGSRVVVLVALLTIPLADLALAVARRLLSGQPFWMADRAHIHHRLLDCGRSAAEVVGILAGLSIVTGLIAFIAAVHGRELVAWSLLAMLCLAVVRFNLVAASEFELLRQFASRRLLDLLATVSLGGLSRRCPRPDELDRLPIAAAWPRFLAHMELHQVEELELTVTGRMASMTHSWRSSMISTDGRAPWSLDLLVGGPAGASCRLRVGACTGGATAPLKWLLLTEAVRTYASHWARHADELCAAVRHETPHGLTMAPEVDDDLAKAA